MSPVCQLNLATCPCVPDVLKQYTLLTLFVSGSEYDTGEVWFPDWDDDAPHGKYWQIRLYRAGDDLIELAPPPGTLLPRGRAMRWSHVVDDVPNVITEVTSATWPVRSAYKGASHRELSKVGGWPTFIQGAWKWRPWTNNPALPMYMFQVDSDRDAGISWGDAGTASFGLDRDGNWHVEWACY